MKLLAGAVTLAIGAHAVAGSEAVDWRARWIWAEGAPQKNSYAYLRKTFDIDGEVEGASAYVAADQWYKLYVNGRYVGRGPSRSGREVKHYDTIDITPHLRPGRNVISAVAHYIGETTHFSAPVTAAFLLLAEVRCAGGKSLLITTDGTWRAVNSPAFDPSSHRIFFPLGFQEVYDARREPEGWHGADFDDSGWAAPAVGEVAPSPWLSMVPRGAPQEREGVVYPLEVVWVGEMQRPGPLWRLELCGLLGSADVACGYAYTDLPAPREMEVTLVVAAVEAARAWLNGEEIIPPTKLGGLSPERVTVGVHLNKGTNRLLLKIAGRRNNWRAFVGFREADAWDAPPRAGDAAWRATASHPPAHEWDPAAPLTDLLSVPYPVEDHLDDPGSAPNVTWVDVPATECAESDIAWELCLALRGPLSACTVRQPEKALRPTGGGTHVRTTPGRSAALLIDFGRELTGYPRLSLDAPAGCVVDATYTEMLTPNGWMDPLYDGVHYGDRYITRSGPQSHEVFAKRAFRYMLLRISDAEDGLTVSDVSLNFSTYPTELRGGFRCSDEALGRIWDTGTDTLTLCMEDAYLDCPRRERGQWWGDARVEALCNFYCFGDSALLRRGLRQMAEVSSDEGLTPCLYPAGGPGFIAGFAMYWIMSLRDYCLFTGDLDLGTELLPRAERIIRAFEGWRDEAGLLKARLPHWWFFDWSGYYGHIEREERQSALANMIYAEALRAAADVSACTADADSAARYTKLREGLVEAAQAFWSDKAGTYVDFLGDDERLSRHVAAWAVLSDVAPPGTWDAILDVAFDDSREVLPEGTPYFAFYVVEALRKAGRHGQAVRYIRGRWGGMLEQGATSWWETWRKAGSLCHAWSAAPTLQLPAIVLGVEPLAPGFARFAVAPQLCGLSYARGLVPTPHGPICVSWRFSDDEFELEVGTPTGCEAEVTLPELPWEPASISVDGDAAQAGPRRFIARGGVVIRASRGSSESR